MPPKRRRERSPSTASSGSNYSASSSGSSLVDGLSSSASSDGRSEVDRDDDDAGLLTTSGVRKRMPGKKQRLRRWRRITVDERDVVAGDGGIVMKSARPILVSLSKSNQELASADLSRALQRVDAELDKVLLPPTPTVSLDPGSSTSLANLRGANGVGSSALYSWRAEFGGRMTVVDDEDDDGDGDEGSKRRETGVLNEVEEDEVEKALGLGGAGFSADIVALESLLLPEATETLELSRTLERQERELEEMRTKLDVLQARARRRVARGDAGESFDLSTFIRPDDALRPLPAGVDLAIVDQARH